MSEYYLRDDGIYACSCGSVGATLHFDGTRYLGCTVCKNREDRRDAEIASLRAQLAEAVANMRRAIARLAEEELLVMTANEARDEARKERDEAHQDRDGVLQERDRLRGSLRNARANIRDLQAQLTQDARVVAGCRAALARVVEAGRGMADVVRVRCRDAVPQWAPELRAALAQWDALAEVAEKNGESK